MNKITALKCLKKYLYFKAKTVLIILILKKKNRIKGEENRKICKFYNKEGGKLLNLKFLNMLLPRSQIHVYNYLIILLIGDRILKKVVIVINENCNI